MQFYRKRLAGTRFSWYRWQWAKWAKQNTKPLFGLHCIVGLFVVHVFCFGEVCVLCLTRLKSLVRHMLVEMVRCESTMIYCWTWWYAFMCGTFPLGSCASASFPANLGIWGDHILCIYIYDTDTRTHNHTHTHTCGPTSNKPRDIEPITMNSDLSNPQRDKHQKLWSSLGQTKASFIWGSCHKWSAHEILCFAFFYLICPTPHNSTSYIS